MITAKEARKALSERDIELQKRELADFELAVEHAAYLGENCVTAETLHENTIKALKKNGYKVKFKLGFLFTDPHWEISW